MSVLREAPHDLRLATLLRTATLLTANWPCLHPVGHSGGPLLWELLARAALWGPLLQAEGATEATFLMIYLRFL